MTLTIIDTFGFLFSNYYALPYLKAKNGTPTGMITGFMNFISNLGRDYKTDYILFSVDSKGKSFRNELYPEYKANRSEAPEELKEQLPIALELIKDMGFKSIEKEGYESDDIIASISEVAKNKGIKVIIVTHDKDMYQLIDDDKVVIFDPRKKIFINEDEAFKKFGVHPKDFINFQALLGDSSDNIPGVKGVGVKTAAKLINEYHTLENLYEHIDEIKGAMKKKLIEGKESAFLSRELVTLKKDMFDDINLDEFKFPEVNPIVKVADKLQELDLHRIIEKVQKEGMFVKTKAPEIKKMEIPSKLITDEKELFNIIDSIGDEVVAFDTETTSLQRDKTIVGFSFAYKENAYYVPINHFYLGVEAQISQESAIKAINKLFTKKIVGHNLKFDLNLVYKYGVKKITPLMDTMILAWIINPDQKVGLDALSKKYLDHEMISFKDTVKKGENFSSVNLEDASKYASEDAYITLKLYEKLKEKLWNEEIKQEIQDVEIPFIDVLMNIENRGVNVDIEYFASLEKEVEAKLNTLTKEIYDLAGEEFNINSTKQLAHILFEKLQLPAKKKTKTGYSTNEAVLNSLKEYPIVNKLLEYRELFKLQSTYIKPLQVYAKKDKKIYTSFLQTGTATGRLSSKDPNLQNIPTNKEINIRNGFIASEGNYLYSLDYSQIELRLLAHFSEDETLIKAFNEDKDIHLETAIKIFGEENAKEYRSVAKSINFGLIYGMGARKLAETINVSNKEAKEFIEKYFASFPTVKDFLNSQKELAKKRGYVETLLGRRRFFNFAEVNSFMASNYEREAVNTIFQGSAADLIKLSMIVIEKSSNNDMILQIHDELIFDTIDDVQIDKYKNIMENIYQLKVPLKVGISKAKRWGEIK
jgi:DNA polymerase-1